MIHHLKHLKLIKTINIPEINIMDDLKWQFNIKISNDINKIDLKWKKNKLYEQKVDRQFKTI